MTKIDVSAGAKKQIKKTRKKEFMKEKLILFPVS